jgi:diaminopimelate epimerase
MCGNGIRCFVKFCVDQLGYTDNPLLVQTDVGLKSCSWETNEGLVSSVAVEMGPALFAPADIPLPPFVTNNPLSLEIDGESVELHCVSMGNPHGVLFGTRTQNDIIRLGRLIQANPCFPHGVNVGFATHNEDHSLSLTVFERGAGLTQACGTGACAAVSAAVSQGIFQFEEEVRVHLPGGDLLIRVADNFEQIWMSGPATHIMEGRSCLG